MNQPTDTMPERGPVRILLVEDNEGDVALTKRMLRGARVPNVVDVVRDGGRALAFLRRDGEYGAAERPDLILLDLNLPVLGGHDVLESVKADAALRSIPVIIFSTSDAPEDVVRSYDRAANCYITKPVDARGYGAVLKAVEDFWLTIARLPTA